MGYDFSKVVKIGNKILLTAKNNIKGCVVTLVRGKEPDPENTVRIGGRLYPTVKIGNQIWLAENLAFDDSGEGVRIIKESEKTNYYDEKTNGFYYNGLAASRIGNSIEGWHLPSIDDWRELGSFVGDVTKLKATDLWMHCSGTDDYGFAARAAGQCVKSSTVQEEFYDKVVYIGMYAEYWSSTISDDKQLKVEFNPGSTLAESKLNISDYYYSIRLIKNM